MTPFLREGDRNVIMTRFNKPDKNTFIYKSKVMDELVKKVHKVAPTSSSVVIIGPTGSGKTSISKMIHERSSVHMGPFITINCATLSPQVLESELFGFKGENYNSSIEGVIRQADGGTLVIEEPFKMPLSIRKKFNEFLYNQIVTPVNSERGYPVKTRIIYNVTDPQALDEGMVDLHNLKDFTRLDIPAIYQRTEDIQDLVYHFLSQNLTNSQDPLIGKTTLTKKAMNVLKCYIWKRNVREIRDVCEHLQFFNHGREVCIRNLPKQVLDTDKLGVDIKYDPTLTLSDVNRIYILRALNHFPSKKKAAQALGITVKTLYNRLHEYGVFEDHAG